MVEVTHRGTRGRIELHRRRVGRPSKKWEVAVGHFGRPGGHVEADGGGVGSLKGRRRGAWRDGEAIDWGFGNAAWGEAVWEHVGKHDGGLDEACVRSFVHSMGF